MAITGASGNVAERWPARLVVAGESEMWALFEPDSRSVAELLTAFLHPLCATHSFGKGIGLAAPQIGITHRAAIVQAPDQTPVVLFNPRVLDASAETDEQYEGCLSFFDVRGIVNRALPHRCPAHSARWQRPRHDLRGRGRPTVGSRDRPSTASSTPPECRPAPTSASRAL